VLASSLQFEVKIAAFAAGCGHPLIMSGVCIVNVLGFRSLRIARALLFLSELGAEDFGVLASLCATHFHFHPRFHPIAIYE
jgi:hypothetical protein